MKNNDKTDFYISRYEMITVRITSCFYLLFYFIFFSFWIENSRNANLPYFGNGAFFSCDIFLRCMVRFLWSTNDYNKRRDSKISNCHGKRCHIYHLLIMIDLIEGIMAWRLCEDQLQRHWLYVPHTVILTWHAKIPRTWRLSYGYIMCQIWPNIPLRDGSILWV